jgi:hypothetical protein
MNIISSILNRELITPESKLNIKRKLKVDGSIRKSITTKEKDKLKRSS